MNDDNNKSYFYGKQLIDGKALDRIENEITLSLR